MIGPRMYPSLYALALLAVGATRLAAQTTTHADTAGHASGTFTVDPSLTHRGYLVWRKQRCWQCHDFGKATRVGPDLRGVMLRHDAAWLRHWLAATDSMLQADSAAIALMVAYGGVRMPQLKMTAEEIEVLLHYIARESELPVGR
jgi:mono/diheme cytochrome c family protein